MRFFFGQTVKRALNRTEAVTKKGREKLAYELLPNFLLHIVEKYLRVRVEGLEHIPKKGPAIIIANHSGFMGLDALILGHQIHENTGRIARIVAHKLWFIRPEISVHAKKMGLVPATYKNALKILEEGELLLLFPEGEEGNFKPSSKRYHMRRFRRGFARLALATGAPVIPATVVGAEETSLTLAQIRWAKPLVGIIIPVPLNVLPLPAKWYLRYFKPIKVEKDPEKAKDTAHLNKLSRTIRKDLQTKLTRQVHKRKRVFF